MNGTLHEEDGRFALRFERRFAHPAEKVWRALTDPAELRHWFPQVVEADLRPGGKMRFSPREGESYDAWDGEVTEFEPPRVFAFLWGTDVLRWELRSDGGGCVLVFTDTFGELGKAARDGAGWHVCLEALVGRLDGTDPPAAGRWREVHPGYASRLGPAASTIGPPAVQGDGEMGGA
jgi:uncharacterized protein YndB with AHSA1/START domain